MHKKAMTLIELILALILVSGIITVVSASLVFFVNQIQANIERSNIYTQMDYALEDMKIRCVSSVGLNAYFTLDGLTSMSALFFQGESNVYHVTLNDLSDNVNYQYYVNANNDLVIRRSDLLGGNVSEEILIEKKFTPGVTFRYTLNSPPNLLEVELTATSNKVPLGANRTITKNGGIRFWFIDAAQ